MQAISPSDAVAAHPTQPNPKVAAQHMPAAIAAAAVHRASQLIQSGVEPTWSERPVFAVSRLSILGSVAGLHSPASSLAFRERASSAFRMPGWKVTVGAGLPS